MNTPLTYWILGAVSLFVFWVNSILIFAEGLKHLARAQMHRQRLLIAAASAEPARASLRIECIAHARTDVVRQELVCRELSLICEPHTILASRTADTFEIETEHGPLAQNWDKIYKDASTARGARIQRILKVTAIPLRTQGSAQSWIVLPGARGEILRRPQQIRWSLVGTLVGTLFCSAMCFVPPLFAGVSQLGALACLTFFLAIQPLTGTLRRWANAHGVPSEQAFSLIRENIDVSAPSI